MALDEHVERAADEALRALARTSLHDLDGRVGIDYGVYGVPETFVIDKAGVIRRKFVGPVTAKMVRDEIVQLVARLNS